MKIAISRPSKGPDEARALFDAARATGFAGVQIKPQQYDLVEHDPGQFREFFGEGADMARAGLVVYPGSEPETWRDRLQPIIHFAAGIGAEEICICAAVGRSDESTERYRSVAEVLHDIGRIARTHAVQVSLHNHAGCLFENAEDLDKLAEHLDPSLCGITFDTAHAAKGGMVDLGEHITRLANHITNVHLKDLAQEGHFCPLGQGTLELTGVLKALEGIGYKRWLVVDEETEGLSVEQACSISMEFIKANWPNQTLKATP
jgi:sugar phosphate isomerase/epimerase